MKKILLIEAVAVLAVFGGCQAVQNRTGTAVVLPATASSAAAETVSDSSQAVSSGARAVLRSLQTGTSSQAARSASDSSSSAADQPADLAKAAVPLDWNRYRLKDLSLKTVKGKKYHEFEIWDEDYSVGPLLLVDPGSGRVYTWTPADSGPVPAAEDKAFDKTPHTVTGVMEDGAMMSILLKTDDGSKLTVRRLGVDTTGLRSMVIGTRIKVTYTGVIKENDMSRAFVTKLENVS